MVNRKTNINEQLELRFEVHASLLQQLGDQLITDEIAAVAELVKNSYDADANFVDININPDWEFINENGELLLGKIEIKDNGHGMDLNDIKRGWLTISNSEKRILKERGIVTKRYERLPLGDKGLGRLSAQRLGSYLVVITKKRDMDSEINVNIDWLKFGGNVVLSQVPIPVRFKTVSNNLIRRSYTNLTIYGLTNTEQWKRTKSITAFENRLAKITSPFDFNRNFTIKAKVGNRQLELPEVSKELLDMAPASYYIKVNRMNIEIIGKYRLEFFPGGVTYGDRLKEFKEIIEKELVKNNLVSQDQGPVVFKYKELINLESLGNLSLNFFPGNFEAFLYDYTLDKGNFESVTSEAGFSEFNNISEFRNHVKFNQGIKIFRDQFRILPYGESKGPGYDWIGLGQGSTSGGSYYDLRPGNVVGYINLTGVENKYLREKTDREGFVEDDYSKTFFDLCWHFIRRINNNREFLRRKYKYYTDEIKRRKEANSKVMPTYQLAKEEIKKAADNAEEITHKTEQSKEVVNTLKDVVTASKKNLASYNLSKLEKQKLSHLFAEVERCSREFEKILSDIFNNAEQVQKVRSAAITLVKEIEMTMYQVQEVMELAGLGLTAETLTHELFTIVNNTKKDTEDCRNYFRKEYEKDYKIEAYLDTFAARAEALRKQVTHLSPGFKSVRTKKEYIKLQSLIDEHFDFYKDRADRLGIKLVKKNKHVNVTVLANRGMLVQVLDNLYSNAEFWLDHAFRNGLINEKKYYIELFSNGLLQIWDNGIGIDQSLEDRIFEPFISSKPEGRGLGLYIITRIASYYNCNIRLMEPRNNFGNRYKLALDLSSIIVRGD